MPTNKKIPANLRLTELVESNTVKLAASPDGGPRRFQMDAYTGAPVETFFGPMVVDLAGLKIGDQKKPIFRQHDPNRIAGYSDAIQKEAGYLGMSGVILDTDSGAEVTKLSDAGFPWQASIGFGIKNVKEMAADVEFEVNGRKFKGPMLVVRQSILKESSFVPLGADGATSGVVLADGDGSSIEIEAATPAAPIEAVLSAIPPEASPRGEAQTVETHQETPAMSEATQASATPAPAANPGANNGANATPTPHEQIQHFNAQAAQNHTEHGRKLGLAEGKQQELARMQEIAAACPNRPDLALNAFLAGQNAATVKLIYDAAMSATAAERSAAMQKDVEIARLNAVIATGGHSGVGFSAKNDETSSAPQGLTPEQQAKYEWDGDAMLRAKFSNREKSYMLFRVNQLNGNVRALNRTA